MQSLRNQSGFSLTEIMVVAVVASIVMAISLQTLVSINSTVQNRSARQELQSAMQEIMVVLNNDTALLNTMKKNPLAFQCLNINLGDGRLSFSGGPTASCPPNPVQITLYDSSNTQVDVVASGPTDGLTPRGAPCKNFDGVNPECPYQIQIFWQPICESATCVNPQVMFFSKVKTANLSTDAPEWNLSQLEFKFVIGQGYSDAASTCAEFSALSVNSCAVASDGACPNGDPLDASVPVRPFAVGFSPLANKICGSVHPTGSPKTGFRCMRGQILSSIDASGIATCSPGCGPPGASSPPTTDQLTVQ